VPAGTGFDSRASLPRVAAPPLLYTVRTIVHVLSATRGRIVVLPFLPQLTLKVSCRTSHWTVDEDLRSESRDGYAFAAQLSYGFDIDAGVRRRN
jgi:hypothetical protein